MVKKYYTDEELISELHRFVKENGRVPTSPEMNPKNGYPAAGAYVNHFGSWNNALEVVNFELNKKQHKGILSGNETCAYCGCNIEQAGQGWLYDENDIRYCYKHGLKPDYVAGNLDINSGVGIGRAGEILVAKVLNINKEFDCNRISCNSKVDLYNDEYGKIDVKTSLQSDNERSRWLFTFKAKKIVDTYICIGLSSDRSNVEHVWIVPNEGKIRNLQNFSITNSFNSLYNNKHWEVDSKYYNDVWQTMKLFNCKIMIDKNEPKVVRTWEETLKALAELSKKYEVKSSV